MSDDNTPKVDAATLLANLKNKTEPVAPEAQVPVEPPVAPVQEVEYQQYTSARVSTCLITPSGKRVNFTNYQYYTNDPEIVRYLDAEIARGLSNFTKGEMLTADELDPETAKRRKIIDEFKASQEGREFGNTKDVSERTNVLSSSEVAN